MTGTFLHLEEAIDDCKAPGCGYFTPQLDIVCSVTSHTLTDTTTSSPTFAQDLWKMGIKMFSRVLEI